MAPAAVEVARARIPPTGRSGDAEGEAERSLIKRSSPARGLPRVLRLKGDISGRGLSMRNDPGELHPLISLRFCAALWLGSIARHELIEKPCRAILSRFTALAVA
jgi:hypothetical protein